MDSLRKQAKLSYNASDAKKITKQLAAQAKTKARQERRRKRREKT